MSRVPQQSHPPLGPFRQRVAVVDAPFIDVVHVTEHAEQGFVPSRIGAEQLALRTLYGPGFLDPLVRDVTGKYIEDIAFADRIADHVPVRTDPAKIFAMGQID